MIITPLGHTEFMVDIENSHGRNVRILVDAWFSDYAFGDLMERTVKLRLDRDKLKTIDAIYISHAHCDHLDPYTLMEIFQEGINPPNPPSTNSGQALYQGGIEKEHPQLDFSLEMDHGEGNHKKPILLLPFTLAYLEGILREYLPDVEIHWLKNRETFRLHDIEITGYMWPNPVITNEDDVMMLAISSEKELVFAEIDTVPDMEDEEVQKSLYKVFTRKEYETACYLASRNCLEGQIPYYDVAGEKRKAFRDHYIAGQKEEILFQYERYEYEEFAHHPNLFALPGFVRGFIGQGIAYPSLMSEELYNLALFPLDEIVSIEHDYAKNAGYSFPQKALLPGRQYKVENGNIEVGRKECGIGSLNIKGNSKLETCSEAPLIRGVGGFVSERIFSSGPLIPRELSEGEIENGKEKILETLNTRFLPYWSASPVASFRDVLIKNKGTYRIKLSVISSEGDSRSREILLRGTIEQDFSLHSKGQEHRQLSLSKCLEQMIIFEYSTSRAGFIEVPYGEKMVIDEDYWFLDVLDFLDGKLEMYSSFWHVLDPKKVYRLWTCLGANFCNNDLLMKKYRFHFEQAKAGKTATEFVEDILKNLISK